MNVITLKNGFYVKGYGLLPKIKSLSRDNNRCYWSMNGTNDNGKSRKVFCDATYGSAYDSYKEAVRTIKGLSVLSKPSNNTVIVERKNKLVPLGITGISLFKQKLLSGASYYFIVNDPVTRSKKKIYIGSDSTIMNNWTDAFLKAKAIRYSNLTKKQRNADLPVFDKLWLESL